MADNSLALIQAKITETEEKLSKLKVAEAELSKLLGASTPRVIASAPTKRTRAAGTDGAGESATAEPKKSVTGRIRDFLKENGPSTAQGISESIGVDTRPISFALQALKRKNEVKMKDGEWSLMGRRKKTSPI